MERKNTVRSLKITNHSRNSSGQNSGSIFSLILLLKSSFITALKTVIILNYIQDLKQKKKPTVIQIYSRCTL